MNRLFGSRVYEAGPIDCAINRGQDWRNEIKPFLQQKGIMVIDPCNKPINNIIKEDEDLIRKLQHYKDTRQWDELSKIMRQIRSTDLRCTDTADWLIVHLDFNIPMMGTLEELFWANRQKKPILVHCEQTLKDIPNWLWGTLPKEFMFDNWNDLKAYIRHIDEDEIINPLRRWVFFDYEKLS